MPVPARHPLAFRRLIALWNIFVRLWQGLLVFLRLVSVKRLLRFVGVRSRPPAKRQSRQKQTLVSQYHQLQNKFSSTWQTLQQKRVGRFSLTSLLTCLFIVQASGLTLWWTMPAFAASTSLRIEPITWDFVGLDSNKPASQGPNTYVVGARVCNVGSSDAINVTTRFVKDGVDNGYTFIQLQASDTYRFPVIAADNGTNAISAASYVFDEPANGSLNKSKYRLASTPNYCQDFYYNFEVSRSLSAHQTYQKYYIEASADNASRVNTPRPRQIYIEQMISQARNYIYDFACDAGSGYQSGGVSVTVGDVFQCRARAHTASAYPQVSFTADIPNVVFQTLDVRTTYSSPAGGKNSTVYADGCGWVQNPTDPRYHRSPSTCEGESGGNGERYTDQYPFGSSKGAVGNDIETTYTIKVLAFPNGIPNPIRVSNIMLDYSGSSYHYNADYGTATNSINITVANPAPTDLSITKTHLGNFSYGANNYTLTIADNANGAKAKAPVTFSDTLPTGYSFTGLSGSDAAKWACGVSAQVVSCTYNNGTLTNTTDDDFPDGAVNTLTFGVTVDRATAAVNSTNFVTISASNDNNTGNNSASDPTTVLSGADVALAKTHSPATFLVGSTGIYTLTITNTGDLDASAPLTITDTLPSGLIFDSFNAAGSSPNWNCSAAGQTVICQNNTDNLDGSDPPDPAGGTATVKFNVNVTSGVSIDATGASVTNVATVSSQTLDIKPSNNTASDPTPTAVPAPDLTITKTDFGRVIASGGTVEYEIAVTNVGSNSTTGVVTVTDTLNAEYEIAAAGSVIAPGYPVGNTTYNNFVNAGWNCTFSGSGTRQLICKNFAPIPAGASSTYRIQLQDSTALSGTPSNTAVVETAGETNTANNSATDTTPLGASGSNQDVSVKKCFDSEISEAEATGLPTVDILCGATSPEPFSYETVGTPAIAPGDTITYEIIVGNESSAGNTEGAAFEDSLPPGLEFPAGNSSFGWRCGALTTGASQGTNSCTPTNANEPSDGSLSQTLPIRLPRISLKKLSGGSIKLPGRVRIFVTARVKPGFSGTLSNTATVSALNSSGAILIDSDTSNNVSSRIVSVAKPDVTIAKSHVGNFAQDIESTYTLTVTNVTATSDGPTSQPIVVTDTLPVSATDKAFEFVAATGTGWSCNYNATDHKVLCTYATALAKGASAPPISVKVIPRRSGAFTNKADVFTGNDKVLTNNTVNDPTTVLAPNVDLSIVKSTANAPFKLGTEVAYTLAVSNHNVSGATAAIAPITITDQLPPGLSFLYSSTTVGAPWVCAATGDADNNGVADGYDTVTCTRYTNISPGETATMNLQVLVSGSTVTGTNAITNQARVTSSSDACANFSCANTNNRTTLSTTVTPTSDLAIAKTLSSSFVAGETGTYAIKVTNNGPSNYGGTVVVIDTLPSGFSFNAAGSGGNGFSCSASGQTVTCTKSGGLLAGASSSFTLPVTISSSTTGLRSNTATFDSATLTSANDPTGDTNDSSSVDVTVQANTSVLTLEKDDGDGETPDEPTDPKLQTAFSQGGQGKYTLVVTNGGPASAQRPVTVSDTLPSDLTYAGYSLTSNWKCTGTVGSSNFSCLYGLWSDTNGDGNRFNDATGFTALDLPANTTSGVEVLVAVNGSAAVGTRSNTAQVTSANGGSAVGSETTNITAPADLQVQKSGLSTATAGGTGTYSLTVTNLGPGVSAPDIYLTDYLPTGLSYISYSGNGWSLVNYNDSANEVTFVRTSSLAVNAPSTLNLMVAVANNAPATVRNLVRVSGITPEPDNPDELSCDRTFITQPTNNCAVQETQIAGGVSTDLSIVKTHGAEGSIEQENYNTNFSYTLKVANLGPAIAEGVSISDTLPASLEFVSVTIDSGDATIANPFGAGTLTRTCSYSSLSRVASCNLLNMATSENTADPVDITLTVKGLVSGQIPNTATVTSNTADSNLTNNTESETVEIVNVPSTGLNIISGTVFEDTDSNQILGSGESGIANVKVQIYQDTGSIIGAVDAGDTLISTVTTGPTGTYSVSLGLDGRFVMAVDSSTLPSGTTFTTDNVEVATFNGVPASPNEDQNNNFGVKGAVTSTPPAVVLVKRITAINGNSTLNVNDNTPLNQVVDDSNADDDNHPNWPNNYLVGAINAGAVQPGNELEYTVYFLNRGSANVSNVRLCDRLSPNQTFVASAYGTGADVQLQLGTSTPLNLTAANDGGDRTQLIAAGSAVPATCNLKAANTNGTLMIDVTGAGGTGNPALTALPNSTGQGTPNDAYGRFRFRTTVGVTP